MQILVIIAVIAIIVFVHELGHFLAAKFFRAGVTVFSIGFGPKILSKKSGDTEYVLSAIPLGGYVKFAEAEDGSQTPPEKWLSSKKPWQKIVITLAGPIFNFLFAIILTVASFSIYGYPSLLGKIGGVQDNSPANRAGIKPGDIVVAVNGQKIVEWGEISRKIAETKNKEVELTIEKPDSKITIVKVPIQTEENVNIFKEKINRPAIGIMPAKPVIIRDQIKSFFAGIKLVKNISTLLFSALYKMFTGRISIKNNLGGPVQIAAASKNIYDKMGLNGLFLFVAFININLAVFNLFPLLPLDGGYLPFLVIEWVRGTPVSQKIQTAFQKVGVILLLFLLVFVLANDIKTLSK